MHDNDAEPEVTWDDVKPGSPAYEKALAAEEECKALRHLMWASDARDIEYAHKLIEKRESYSDYSYAYWLIGEVAERLREARDHPEKRELRRWQKVQFAAAVSAGRPPMEMIPFLFTAFREFEFDAAKPPADEKDLYSVAVHTMAMVLDVPTSDPKKFGNMQSRITAAFCEMFPGVAAAASSTASSCWTRSRR
jgi:hypothetical protein